MKTGVMRTGRAVTRTAIKLSLCLVPLAVPFFGAACAMETGSGDEPTAKPEVAVEQVATPGENTAVQPGLPGVRFSNPTPVPWKQPTGTQPGASTEDPGQPQPWHCGSAPCPPSPNNQAPQLVTNPSVPPGEVEPK